MRVSRYVKAHKDILLEYIYDDGNNISEGYKILINSRENTNSFVSIETSASNNTVINQLFPLDRITDYYGIVNTKNYSFLQYKEFASGFPIRFDMIKVHLPINYIFGEYLGCYVRIYSLDSDNRKEYNLSNFYYDQSDVNLSGMINFTAPPLKFQEKLWGKSLDISIPSTYFVSRQMSGTAPKSNTVNSNLTNGKGLSQTAPIFIDFSFITKKVTISGITSYYLTAPKKISFPQTPEFENLGVKIEPSVNGDFFEIYGIFNGSLADFKIFIDNSRLSGKRYYVEFDITLFEQNIRGKSINMRMTSNFNEKVEYRPIIKYTTTTAVIDVEMRLIDSVDDSIIYRRASYGMLQDEVSKYSLNMTKINITNANKPKVYGLKNITTASSGDSSGLLGNRIFLEPVNIDRTVLVDKFNLIAKSDSVNVGKNVFYGIGKLKIILQPFDNIVLFIIARDVSTEQTPGIDGTGNLSLVRAPEYLDMTNMGEINFVIKNGSIKFETSLFVDSGSVDLSRGQCVFKIPESSMKDIRRIFDSGQNLFYITSKLNSQTTSIYSGLFDIYDAQSNIDTINLEQAEIQRDVLSAEKSEVLIDSYSQNTAIVYRRRITTPTNTTSATSSVTGINNSSIPATIKLNQVTYTITVNSALVIDGYEWTNQQIKKVLNLDVDPIQLTIRTDSLFSSERFLQLLEKLSIALKTTYLTTTADITNFNQVVQNFKNTNP
jgi:hypothetical protein